MEFITLIKSTKKGSVEMQTSIEQAKQLVSTDPRFAYKEPNEKESQSKETSTEEIKDYTGILEESSEQILDEEDSKPKKRKRR